MYQLYSFVLVQGQVKRNFQLVLNENVLVGQVGHGISTALEYTYPLIDAICWNDKELVLTFWIVEIVQAISRFMYNAS